MLSSTVIDFENSTEHIAAYMGWKLKMKMYGEV